MAEVVKTRIQADTFYQLPEYQDNTLIQLIDGEVVIGSTPNVKHQKIVREVMFLFIDQVWILQTFPDYSWKALTERMCYHFGKGWWKAYNGEKKYNRDTTWADTEEAHMDRAQQLMSSEGCTVRWIILHEARQYSAQHQIKYLWLMSI